MRAGQTVVILVSRSDIKLTAAKDLGVWETVISVRIPDWDNAVLELTENKGVELVLDMGLSDSLRYSARDRV